MDSARNRDVDEAIIAKAHALLPYVYLANVRDVTVSDVRDVPTLLVALFEALTSEEVADRCSLDGGREQASLLQKILDTLENTLEHVSLSHLSGPGLVRLDRRQLSEALEIFEDLLQHMFQPDVTQSSNVKTYATNDHGRPVECRLTLSQLQTPPEVRTTDHPDQDTATPSFTPKLSMRQVAPEASQAYTMGKSDSTRQANGNSEKTIENMSRSASGPHGARDTQEATNISRRPHGERFVPYRQQNVRQQLREVRKLSTQNTKSTYTLSAAPSVKSFKKNPLVRLPSSTSASVKTRNTSERHLNAQPDATQPLKGHRKQQEITSSKEQRASRTSVPSGPPPLGRRFESVCRGRKGSTRSSRTSRVETFRGSRAESRSSSIVSRRSVDSVRNTGKGDAAKLPPFSRKEITRQPIRQKKELTPETALKRRPSVRSTKVIRHSLATTCPQRHKASEEQPVGKQTVLTVESPRTSSLSSSITLLKEFHNIEKRLRDIRQEKHQIHKELQRLRQREERLSEEEVRLDYVIIHLRGVLLVQCEYLNKPDQSLRPKAKFRNEFYKVHWGVKYEIWK